MALALLKHDSPRPCSRSSSVHVAAKTSWTPSALRLNRTDPDLSISFDDSGLLRDEGEETWKTLDNIAALGLTLNDNEDKSTHSADLPRLLPDGDDGDNKSGKKEAYSLKAGPFHKWMKTLHRRAHRSRIHATGSLFEPFPEYSFGTDGAPPDGHRKSSSGSSFGFVAAVRSASVSLASNSVITRPRRHTARSSLHGRTDRSSRGSMSAPRFSEDSVGFEQTFITDPGVTERLLQRRRILEELINTEESYIGDIKFLMNVYVTILASLPTAHMGLRSSINRNLTDIVELHEEILGELHRVVPDSEYTQPDRIPVTPNPPPVKRHHRWRSLDSVPENKRRTSWLQNVPSVIAEPSIAADVAQIFGNRMNRFFVYEEYGAKYEMMVKDVASAHRTLPQWETYQKGLEALAASLGAVNYHIDHSKKSLTIGDLLVKPIQRICRYPLLFAELLKYTPVCDCPNSHIGIENVLVRLREATAEINRATDDPGMKATMEQTWLLQDRLVFPNQRLDAASKTTIRSFGQVRLCGALYVCWQTRDGVAGEYMVTLLYKNYLCLATASKVDHIYTIQACISLGDIKIEEVDNCRGLQCHTAPYSWKLVFECDHQLYEIIMTACSPKEEMEWRSRLSRCDLIESHESSEPAFYSSISLNIKTLGTVFGKPGTVARRLSIHRATTVGPKSPLCQVIVKNTSVMKDTSSATSASPINRSQSLLTTNSRIPVLAPSRGDRARLEALLADVWSRNLLPFPGITTRSRSEHLVRSSASTVMRKLSVASITNSFSKRSTSAGVMKSNDDELPHVSSFVDALVSTNCDVPGRSVSGPDITEEDDAKRRLPMIRDEVERAGSTSPTSAVDAATLSGTVRRLDRSKLDPWLGEDAGIGTPALRNTSPNSIRQIRQTPPPTARSSPSNTDKENVSQGPQSRQQARETLHNTRPTSKWSRVSAINRGLMASGIRSFFR
ncbi:Dbl homology domain-containing protein [Xylariaceae sp. FL0662B]|nr:Dbl homology domain-containing protein [Xylariaceae sp. FL0662B]